MAARCLYHKKQEYQGGIVEIVIWQLPDRDSERPHGLKYRLVYVKEGRRIVGYDNERGKGDHRHIREREHRYVFRGIEQLVRDFWEDVRRCSDG
jgi:hypothetical protein